MTFPGFIFSLFLATMLGSLLHIWRGGKLSRLVYYLLLSWIGFFVGHFLAEILSIRFLDVGTVHVGFGILGVIVFLGLGYWLIPEKKSV